MTSVDRGAVTTALEARPALVSRRLPADLSAFSIDIETNPADADRVLKIGAVRSDSDAVVALSTGRLPAGDVARRVDAVAAGA